MIRNVVEGLIVKIKIVPNSSRNDIILEDEFIKVKITAQPIENKANKALIVYLSKIFKVPKSSIGILKGDTSKEKILLFRISDKIKQDEIVSKLKNRI